jgi:A/G-specific adenine glycosylase
VASIAFGTKTAAVDGNVYRVITRVKMIKGDPLKGDAAKEIRRVADAFVDAERPGDFNQAMMELGATVCTPQNPKCDSCPISAWCGGFAKQRETSGVFKVTAFPETAKKAEKRQEQRAFVVLRRAAHGDGDTKPEFEYLLSKRPEGGLLGGLWEFPNALIAIEPDDTFALRPKSDVRNAHDALCEELGASSRQNVDAVSGKAVHIFSHIRQVMHYQLVDSIPRDTTAANGDDIVARNAPERELKWFPARAFEESGVFSSGVVKVYSKCTATSVLRAKPNASGAQKRLRDAGASCEIDASQTSIKAFFGSAVGASPAPGAHRGTKTSAGTN